MTEIKNLIFVGPVLSYECHLANRAASSATSAFITNILDSLRTIFDISHINFAPDRIFPAGRLIPSVGVLRSKMYISRYLNLLLLSSITKAISISAGVIFSIKNSKGTPIVIFYNWHYYYLIAYLYCRIKKIEPIVFLADYRVPKFVKKVIVINNSRAAVEQAHRFKCIYFPGFVGSKFPDKSDVSEISIGYCGGYGSSSDIDKFVGWFIKNSSLNVTLQLFGHITDEIKRLSAKDIRIKVSGFLSTEELDRRLSTCNFFIEPRNKNVKEYGYSFPSKLLYYTKFSGLIFTNAIEALSPKMRLGVIDISDGYEVVIRYCGMEMVDLRKISATNKLIFEDGLRICADEFHKFLEN